jgi:hypothetical protein
VIFMHKHLQTVGETHAPVRNGDGHYLPPSSAVAGNSTLSRST